MSKFSPYEIPVGLCNSISDFLNADYMFDHRVNQADAQGYICNFWQTFVQYKAKKENIQYCRDLVQLLSVTTRAIFIRMIPIWLNWMRNDIIAGVFIYFHLGFFIASTAFRSDYIPVNDLL